MSTSSQFPFVVLGRPAGVSLGKSFQSSYVRGTPSTRPHARNVNKSLVPILHCDLMRRYIFQQHPQSPATSAFLRCRSEDTPLALPVPPQPPAYRTLTTPHAPPLPARKTSRAERTHTSTVTPRDQSTTPTPPFRRKVVPTRQWLTFLLRVADATRGRAGAAAA